MTAGRRLREGFFVAGVLLRAIIAMRMGARAPGDLSTLDGGILRIVSPAQSAMSSLARGIGGIAGRYVELTHVRAENEKLSRENARLHAELVEVKRVAAESGRYQRLLG